MLEIARLMVMMQHHLWAIFAVLIIGVVAFLFGSNIKNTAGRVVVLGVAMIFLAFFFATGLGIAPLDEWQHQHGNCLLESLEKAKKR